VRTESIGEAGEGLGYAPLIRMSRGEKQGSEAAKLHIVANAFEALVGAIYLDQGYDTAKELVERSILIKLDNILAEESWRDPKSYLQEISQRVDSQTPQYKVLTEEGPDHDKVFEVGVYVAGKIRGKGSGTSKNMAQQRAAKKAIETYDKSPSKKTVSSPAAPFSPSRVKGAGRE
jgi:ribonuclease-3